MKSGLVSNLQAWLINLTSLLAFLLFIIPITIIHSMNWINPPLTSFMLSQKAIDPQSSIEYEWKDWEDMTVSTPLAIIAAKDQRFSTRPGIDVHQLKYVLSAQHSNSSIHETSAITKQTAKNLFLWSDNVAWGGLESWLTFLLETSLDKQRILEIYLNIAEFSPGVYGIEAASQKFFYKPANKLSDNESALLATVLSEPKPYNARTPSALFQQRQRWVMNEMKSLDQIAFIHEFAKDDKDSSYVNLF